MYNTLLKINKITIIFLMSLFILPSYADTPNMDSQILTAAKNFVLHHVSLDQDETIDVNINPEHSFSQLPICSKEITVALPANSNKEQISTLELTCEGKNPWHVFIPVDVQISTKVLVAKRTIAPHEPITDNEIDYIQYNKNRLYHGYFNDKQQVIGSVASHLITAGSVLTKTNIQPPLLVHRNQVISLISRSGAVVVTMQGIAKEDGSLDAFIKVYNPSSKRVLDAVVIGPNKAQVNS